MDEDDKMKEVLGEELFNELSNYDPESAQEFVIVELPMPISYATTILQSADHAMETGCLDCEREIFVFLSIILQSLREVLAGDFDE